MRPDDPGTVTVHDAGSYCRTTRGEDHFPRFYFNFSRNNSTGSPMRTTGSFTDLVRRMRARFRFAASVFCYSISSLGTGKKLRAEELRIGQVKPRAISNAHNTSELHGSLLILSARIASSRPSVSGQYYFSRRNMERTTPFLDSNTFLECRQSGTRQSEEPSDPTKCLNSSLANA